MALKPKKIPTSPLEANTHWQNKNYETIPIGLRWLRNFPSRNKKGEKIKNTNDNFYHYNGNQILVKEIHRLHLMTDGNVFEIYCGLN